MFKTHSAIFKAVALMAATVFMAVPILTETANAQESVWAKGYAAGEQDSKASWKWFLAGFFLNGIGLLIAYTVEPNPSFEVNRSNSLVYSLEYAQGYTVGYKSRGKGEQGKKAWLGFITVVSIALFWLINRQTLTLSR